MWSFEDQTWGITPVCTQYGESGISNSKLSTAASPPLPSPPPHPPIQTTLPCHVKFCVDFWDVFLFFVLEFGLSYLKYFILI